MCVCSNNGIHRINVFNWYTLKQTCIHAYLIWFPRNILFIDKYICNIL